MKIYFKDAKNETTTRKHSFNDFHIKAKITIVTHQGITFTINYYHLKIQIKPKGKNF